MQVSLPALWFHPDRPSWNFSCEQTTKFVPVTEPARLQGSYKEGLRWSCRFASEARQSTNGLRLTVGHNHIPVLDWNWLANEADARGLVKFKWCLINLIFPLQVSYSPIWTCGYGLLARSWEYGLDVADLKWIVYVIVKKKIKEKETFTDWSCLCP